MAKAAKKAAAAKSAAAKKPAARKKPAAAKKPSKAGSDAELAAFDRLYEALAGKGITRKSMFGADSLSIGGKGFAMLHKGRLVLKLGPARVDELVAARAGEPFDPGMGRPMKGWIALADRGPKWSALAREALASVAKAAKS